MFVGDFLFYLRLLARQFAELSKELGDQRKNMVIVPDLETAWEQLGHESCEAVILDCVEFSDWQLDCIRAVRAGFPRLRLILISAALDRSMEASLMEAGAHLCFTKPRSVEEAGSMYRLVAALTGSQGFYPNGNFKGLAPARFIQFFCARGESGSIAMETELGPATLMMEAGRIVDARLGDISGDEAAARILSLDRTQRCRFQHMQTSQYHTINLDTHQLWRDAGSLPVRPIRPKGQAQSAATQAKSLHETFESLDAAEGLSVDFHLESSAIGADQQRVA
ncbi:MAG: hypothetical protein Fur0032_24550 [Terrimicrobiaceae bacterium]